MCMKGQDCSKDQRKGFQFYQRGAKVDVPKGLYKTGCCLMRGKGTTKDLSQARSLPTRAAEEGSGLISIRARTKLAPFHS